MTKLSLIISTRNDPVGTMITVRSAIEEFKSCDFGCEIVIVDNSDIESQREILVDLIEPFINRQVKLYFQPFPCLFSARDLAVENSSGEYILIVDSHCIFYKGSLNEMVHEAESIDNLGILFGSMCYSMAHELDAFCDRYVDRFLPIRVCAYTADRFKIPLRSMPMLMRRNIWDEMIGYAPLSTHKLVWGGGDFLISFKPLLMGYDNWVSTSVGVVHLGPFHDRGFFISSYLDNASQMYTRFIGMLTAAYVIGGQELLVIRSGQIENRLAEFMDISRMQIQARQFGEEYRRYMNSISTRSYKDLVDQFKGFQGDHELRHYDHEPSLFPSANAVVSDAYSPIDHSGVRIKKSSSWQSRMSA